MYMINIDFVFIQFADIVYIATLQTECDLLCNLMVKAIVTCHTMLIHIKIFRESRVYQFSHSDEWNLEQFYFIEFILLIQL